VNVGITCYPTVGGSGAVAAELGKQLARRGHFVHFVSYRLPFRLDEFSDNIRFHEIDVTTYSLFEYPPHDLALAAKMAEVAREHRLDLFHVHYAIPHAITGFLAQEMLGADAPRLITTLHGTDITLVGQERSYWDITRFSILKSDGITAVSSYLRQETMDAFRVPGDRIEVIHNFVDAAVYDRSRYPCHKAAFLRKDERLVVHVSNFRPVKRIRDVVGIFARAVRQVPARLVFIGDGPERPAAVEEAERLGVADRVVFLGKQDSVAELLSCADLLLLPSQSESFGLVALEAMACGVPVVASDVGGIREVVDHGVSGYLAPVGDVDAMGDYAAAILRDRDLWRRMSGDAQHAARERFGVDVIIPRYERYYERILAADAAAEPALAVAGEG
jgi:L-malate glycosyltransferase